MYKVKRTIYVDNQSIDVWFGLVSKTKNGKKTYMWVYRNRPFRSSTGVSENFLRNCSDRWISGLPQT